VAIVDGLASQDVSSLLMGHPSSAQNSLVAIVDGLASQDVSSLLMSHPSSAQNSLVAIADGLASQDVSTLENNICREMAALSVQAEISSISQNVYLAFEHL
jgi:hypothetical protein